MPIVYELDRDADLIVETWSGTITAADLAKYWRGYLGDAEVMACRRTLVDLRDATIAFTGAQLDDLVREVVLPRVGKLGWRTAVVVDHPTEFGVARQYQVFAERYSRDAIFFDEEQARSWLLEERPA